METQRAEQVAQAFPTKLQKVTRAESPESLAMSKIGARPQAQGGLSCLGISMAGIYAI